MPGKVANETIHHLLRKTITRVEPMHVEQVPRMLPVHRCHQFAPVKLRHGERRERQAGGEKISRRRNHQPLLDRKHGAAEDVVGFHLHQARAAADEQLAHFAALGGDQLRLDAKAPQLPAGREKGVGDRAQCRLSSDAVIDEHEVEIDRKPGHVGREKIDRGPAFQGKRAALED